MWTDDDLTRELGAAFRAETENLCYRGRRRPRSTAVVGLPVAAATVAIGALAVNGALGSAPGPAPALPRPHTSAPAAAETSSAARAVTEKVRLAGFTFTYEADRARFPILISRTDGHVPGGAREIPLPGSEARAWVGKDPGTGDNALWFRSDTRANGELFELHAPTWSEADLVSLVRTGRPAD